MKYFVVIPAAGISTRMGAELPKQYLKIHHKTILEHTLACFLTEQRFEKIALVIHQHDQYWQTLNLQHPKLMIVVGGVERSHSVLNGLTALKNHAENNDWLLVHDAARPCLQKTDLDKLIATLKDHPVGGLLGAQVRDTIKRVNESNEVVATVDRNALWQAFTPQMFRFEKLYKALKTAIDNKQTITDEASAIELIGEKSLMIAGEPTNIKITHPADLLMAEMYLKHQ